MKCLLIKLIVGSITFSIGISAVFIGWDSSALITPRQNTVFIIKPVTSKDTVLIDDNYCSRGNPEIEEKIIKKLNLEEIAIKKSNRKLRKLGK